MGIPAAAQVSFMNSIFHGTTRLENLAAVTAGTAGRGAAPVLALTSAVDRQIEGSMTIMYTVSCTLLIEGSANK
jgi:hypothetical protein